MSVFHIMHLLFSSLPGWVAIVMVLTILLHNVAKITHTRIAIVLIHIFNVYVLGLVKTSLVDKTYKLEESIAYLCFKLNDAGNPRVTPEVTRDVCLLARMMAANLYFSQIEDLMFEVYKQLPIFESNLNFSLMTCSLI